MPRILRTHGGTVTQTRVTAITNGVATRSPSSSSSSSVTPAPPSRSPSLEIMETPLQQWSVAGTYGARSVTPPTISPLSQRPSPTLSSSDEDRESRSESETREHTPSPTLSRGGAQPMKQEDEEEERWERGGSYSPEPFPTEMNGFTRHQELPEHGPPPPDYSKPIYFTPYFKREGFVKQPPISGKEAWAKGRVWNENNGKFEHIDFDKLKKYGGKKGEDVLGRAR